VRRLLRKTLVPLLLCATYFLVVSPLAFVLRIAGRDPMHRRFDSAAQTYRMPSRAPSRERLERAY
jgi:hypothetical protein